MFASASKLWNELSKMMYSGGVLHTKYGCCTAISLHERTVTNCTYYLVFSLNNTNFHLYFLPPLYAWVCNFLHKFVLTHNKLPTQGFVGISIHFDKTMPSVSQRPWWSCAVLRWPVFLVYCIVACLFSSPLQCDRFCWRAVQRSGVSKSTACLPDMTFTDVA